MHNPHRTRFALTALAAVLAVPLAGCEGSDITINDQKGVPLAEIELAGAPPSELVLASGDTVILTEGETLAVTVEGSDTDSLRFVRDAEVIGVSRAEGWNGGGKAVIRITMPPPREIIVAGSGTVEAQGLASEADINIGGSGRVRFARIAATRLGINVGGSGEVSGAGTAKELEILIGGSGDITMPGLKADTADITIGGSGDVAFASDGTVEANIGGAGDIKVTGSATCKLESFGSGTLTCTPGTSAAPAPAASASPAQ